MESAKFDEFLVAHGLDPRYGGRLGEVFQVATEYESRGSAARERGVRFEDNPCRLLPVGNTFAERVTRVVQIEAWDWGWNSRNRELGGEDGQANASTHFF